MITITNVMSIIKCRNIFFKVPRQLAGDLGGNEKQVIKLDMSPNAYQRFKQLAKHTFVIDRMSSTLMIGGFIVSLIILILIGLILNKNYALWNNLSYFKIFIFYFFAGGAIYAGNSFNYLRSKEARYSYLMIPATALEKYVFEFIVRILAFVLLMPCIFWLISNAEGYIVHLFVSDFAHFNFSFLEALNNTNRKWEEFSMVWLTINISLLFFTIPFTGATYFKKNPFAKLLFSVAIIFSILLLYGFVCSKLFGLKHYRPVHLFFLTNDNQANIFVGTMAFITNIICLAIGYYNVKEKEA